jgi:HD-GYP domain-containing protein (c-di-GMP phosphodiesterase class II)
MAMTYKIIDTEQPAAFTATKKMLTDDVAIEMLQSKQLKEFSHRKNTFFNIAKNSILPGSTVNFKIYIQKAMDFEVFIDADNERPVLIDNDRAWNISQIPSELAIENNDIAAYKTYLQSLTDASKLAEDETIYRKAVVIKENSKIVMKDILEDPRSGEKIKEVKNAVGSITDSLLENPDLIYSMLSLTKYDYYTYTHCVNVAVLSVGLGIAIGGMATEEVKTLGIGAMLHDIGKTAIAPEILNKQGRLNDYEYRVIQGHVKEGEKLLQGVKEIPAEAHEAVVQHHEKLSGRGYPYGLSGKEIGLFGRITAIADCYDALTTKRPYKQAFSPYEALKIISKDEHDYDPELLIEFVKMLGKVK